MMDDFEVQIIYREYLFAWLHHGQFEDEVFRIRDLGFARPAWPGNYPGSRRSSGQWTYIAGSMVRRSAAIK